MSIHDGEHNCIFVFSSTNLKRNSAYRHVPGLLTYRAGIPEYWILI